MHTSRAGLGWAAAHDGEHEDGEQGHTKPVAACHFAQARPDVERLFSGAMANADNLGEVPFCSARVGASSAQS